MNRAFVGFCRSFAMLIGDLKRVIRGNRLEQVSLGLASINARFAIVYGQEGHDVAAHRHLSILSQTRISVRQLH